MAIRHPSTEEPFSAQDKMLAWSAHAFTATGALWGLLGLIAATAQNWRGVFFWFIVASFVDGVDGLLARRFRVKSVLPHFDGALLDNIIDYLTYVIVPALFLYYMPGMLPPGWELCGAAIISCASAYQFCQADAKTDDHTFKGFPSYWNIVVFYLFALQLAAWLNLAVLAFLSVMVFVPIRYAYPSRMEKYQRLTIFFTVVWALLVLVIWLMLPTAPAWLVYLSLLYIVYYVAISLWMMWQKRP